MNKKGLRWLDAWGETATLTFLVIGLIVCLLIDSAVVSYAVILVCGVMVGRLYNIRKHRLGFPFYLIIFGYLVGYIIGNLITRRGHWLIILIFFAIGCWLGDYIMHRKWSK